MFGDYLAEDGRSRIDDGYVLSSIFHSQSSLLFVIDRLNPYHHYLLESSRVTGLRHNG